MTATVIRLGVLSVRITSSDHFLTLHAVITNSAFWSLDSQFIRSELSLMRYVRFVGLVLEL